MSAKAKAERDRKAEKAEKVKVKRDRKAARSEIALRIRAVDINGKPMFYDEQMSRSRSFYDTRIELANVGYFDDKDRWHEAFSEWHASSDRKTLEGVCFHPTAPGAPRVLPPSLKNHLNIWTGWPVKPIKDAGSYDRFKDLIKYGLCAESEELAVHVWAWIGHMVQHPAELPGTALVMYGPQGIGKDTIFKVLASLCPKHSIMLDTTEQLTGTFSGHLEGKLLVDASEACFSKDKAAIGRLKSLVASEEILINEKFKPAYVIQNKIRLIITTNFPAAAPVEAGDRRWMVFKFSDLYKEDLEFFGELHRELDNGGREALFSALVRMNLASMPDPRVVPKTKARTQQQVLHLDSVKAFALYAIESGEIVTKPTYRYATGWPQFVAVSDLLDSYEKFTRQQGERYPAQRREFLKGLKTLLALGPSKTLRLTDSQGESRVPRVRMLPSLEVAAKAFETETGIAPELPSDIETFEALPAGDATDDNEESAPVDLAAYRNKTSAGMTGTHNG